MFGGARSRSAYSVRSTTSSFPSTVASRAKSRNSVRKYPKPPARLQVKSRSRSTPRPLWNDAVTNLDDYRLSTDEVLQRKAAMSSKNATIAKVMLHDRGRRSPNSEERVHGKIFREICKDFDKDLNAILNRSIRVIEESQSTMRSIPSFKYKNFEVTRAPVDNTRRSVSPPRILNCVENCKADEEKSSTPVPATYALDGSMGDHNGGKENFDLSSLQQALIDIQQDYLKSPKLPVTTYKEKTDGALSTFSSELVHTLAIVSKQYRKVSKELAVERSERKKLENCVEEQNTRINALIREFNKLKRNSVAYADSSGKSNTSMSSSAFKDSETNLHRAVDLRTTTSVTSKESETTSAVHTQSAPFTAGSVDLSPIRYEPNLTPVLEMDESSSYIDPGPAISVIMLAPPIQSDSSSTVSYSY